MAAVENAVAVSAVYSLWASPICAISSPSAVAAAANRPNGGPAAGVRFQVAPGQPREAPVGWVAHPTSFPQG